MNRTMSRLLLILILSLLMCTPAAGEDAGSGKLFERIDSTGFILIDKENLFLILYDKDKNIEKIYGIACAVNYGNKEFRGDNKTPEGRFTINEVLYAKDIPHDFNDGKGPVAGAYGPWFLRLDVPGFRDIGIHGTHLPNSIGTRCTEGCIRMKNDDITDLKEKVFVGMPVIILPDK